MDQEGVSGAVTTEVAPVPVAGDHPWHALTPEETAEALASSDPGLSDAQVTARRARFGRNQIAEQPPTSPLVMFVRQFRDPLIYILVGAAVATLLLREYLDTAVIVTVLVVNSLVGFIQERGAERAVRALAQLVVPRARVVRDGHEQEIDSRDLVPGDMVLLEPGCRVPADLRLVRVTALEADESLLTGESAPVTKQVAPVEKDSPLADRRSMAYTGSVITSGRGRGIVVATGEDTELGAIADLIRGTPDVTTPMQQRMARFGRLIGIVVGVSALVAFVSGLAIGGSVRDMFLVAVALSVAAIPEGLPVAVTVALALGVHRMARRNAIIRRLPAVETLGSTTVIGSDKTGTLTENRMTVQEIWAAGEFHRPGAPAPAGSPLHLTLLTGVLTNEAKVYHAGGRVHTSGDPTEVALLVAAEASGMVPDELRDDYPTFAEIPFEPQRRYSASVRLVDGDHRVFVKGAPERVLRMCHQMLTPDGVAPLDRESVVKASRTLAERGLRVLAMAGRVLPAPPSSGDVSEPDGLVFFGLQGMMDPPRAGVPEAVRAAQRAGIRVIMITGDNAVTARAIAARLGIITGSSDAAESVLTGAQLATMNDERLRELVPRVAVFARMTPEEKLRVVRALQHHDEVVAVTGDGVNDAPALKSAAIGIAMGRSGTDVAREASDMVLADDNFVSITNAVEEGRVAFANVRRVSFFLISTGVATIAAILVGLWLGWPLLMLPAQLVWLNLVTNGLQDFALAFEPGDKRLLEQPPRPRQEGIISRLLWWRLALVGLVMAAGTLYMFDWSLTTTGSVAQAQTVALTTMVMFQAFHLGNSRSVRRSVFRLNPLTNPFLLISSVAALAVHIGALYAPPTQWLLRVEPIDVSAWLRIVPVALSVVVVVEVEKFIRNWRS
ncbi:MAG TPA: HAD-IC family P-type ATPase [Natronosporangium sp.]|nr:HAD-IC family P-type ATPase [Natronosporangium sp.]